MTAERRRLFFALWPDEAVRARLDATAVAAATSGRRTACENLHLTLIFLGMRGAEERARALAAPDDLAPAAFDLCLDRLGYFPRARTLWLGPERVPNELIALFEALNRRLSAAGVNAELRNADPARFRPHVTLGRKALPPSAATRARVTPVHWRVNGFALIESKPGGRSCYEMLKRW